MNGKISAVITGARAPVALHLARLLAAAGHRVTLVDHLKRPIAAASQLGLSYRQIPSFVSDATAAGAALAAIVQDRSADIVIPTCEEVLHLAALWARNPPKAELFAPDIGLLETVHNKYNFIRLCHEIGLPTPQTRLLSSQDELLACADQARHLVFKPVWSRFGAAVAIQPDAKSVRRLKPTPAQPWVAQDYVAGTEVCVYAVARSGRILALAAYRGLVRAGHGAAVCFTPFEANLVRPFVERFVDATGWTGQISFDLMLTDKGQVVPLECNPRATSGLHFFSDAAAFSAALFGQGHAVAPNVTDPLAVRLALLIYGVPMMLRRVDRQIFLNALHQSADVMNWPSDRIGWGAQLASVAEFASIAMRRRIRLDRASTWDIEWNGPVQSVRS